MRCAARASAFAFAAVFLLFGATGTTAASAAPSHQAQLIHVASAAHTTKAASSKPLVPTATPVTGAYFDSEPNDYIGQGKTYYFPSVTTNGPPGPDQTFIVSSPTDSFYIEIGSPTASPIVPGTYENAQRAAFRDPGSPGLDVFGDGRGCNTVAARFVVDDATYDKDGNVLTFAMQFELHCEAGQPALFGDISYNSTSPFYAQSVSPATLSIDAAGELDASMPLTISNVGNAKLDPGSYSFTQQNAEDFYVAHDGCAGGVLPGKSCSLEIGYHPSGDRTESAAIFHFADQAAPLGPPGEMNTEGTGRQVSVTGQSYDGYYSVGSDGSVDNFGDAPSYGEYEGTLNSPVVGMAMTGDDGGYWLAATDGGIFCFGDANFYGSAGDLPLNKPIVGMAATPDGGGYWMVASDGGIFSYGDAAFYGSTGSISLNKPIVGMASTPDGRGYWLVASDGGIFSYGDAAFYGSTGSISLNQPIVGMASTPSGGGYWMVASDGGIFSFGDAGFQGSTGSLVLNEPIVGMAATPDGGGYWLEASDGGVFSFGNARFLGSSASSGFDGWVSIVPLFSP
jgi:hypothetical protein